MLGHARLLLAFGVLLAHGKLLPEATSRSMVSAFFVVSGYLMMLTLSANYGRAVQPFYWNRVLRIWPLHVAVCLLVALLFPHFVKERFAEHARLYGDYGVVLTTLMSLLLLPRYAGFFNKPAWTLPFEVFYYILAPLIVRLGVAGILAYMAIGCAGFAAIMPIADLFEPFGLSWTASGRPEGFLASFVYFGFGALLFELQRRRAPAPGSARVLTWAGLALLVGTLLATLRFWSGSAFDGLQRWDGIPINLLALSAVSLVLVAWDGRETARSKLAGDLCYPVYMLHFMFTDYLVDVGRYRATLVRLAEHAHWPDLEFVLRSLVASAGALLLGLAWLALEKRTIRTWRLPGRRRAQAPAWRGATEPVGRGEADPAR